MMELCSPTLSLHPIRRGKEKTAILGGLMSWPRLAELTHCYQGQEGFKEEAALVRHWRRRRIWTWDGMSALFTTVSQLLELPPECSGCSIKSCAMKDGQMKSGQEMHGMARSLGTGMEWVGNR
jgi:hypothetical protein